LTPLKVLKGGSDCSGWASEVWALLKLGVNKVDHVFACDINRWSKKFIMANDPPKVWLDDVLAVDHHEQAPYVDVYVAGFPCQPFSAAGTNLGTKDARGKVIHGVMKYIEYRLPTIFVLENVKKPRLSHSPGVVQQVDRVDEAPQFGGRLPGVRCSMARVQRQELRCAAEP
jgi:site-specific DNA-cytosine methylase